MLYSTKSVKKTTEVSIVTHEVFHRSVRIPAQFSVRFSTAEF